MLRVGPPLTGRGPLLGVLSPQFGLLVVLTQKSNEEMFPNLAKRLERELNR